MVGVCIYMPRDRDREYTCSVWNLLVTVGILGSLGYELDPVLHLGHPGIHAVAGTLTSIAHHTHLGESV